MNINKVLSREELDYFLKRPNWRGFYEIGVTYSIIAASLALVAFYPSPLTVIVALILLGGRHLALAILTHDASHYALFSSKKLNLFFGKWFIAAPMLLDVAKYRTYHLQHHKYTGQPYKGEKGDPDLNLVRNYPIGRKSLHRWFLRDLSGLLGLKQYLGLALMSMDVIKTDLSGRVTMLELPKQTFWQWIVRAIKGLHPFLITHAIFITTLTLLGYWWLYFLWVGAGITTYMFFLRLRSISEHAVLERSPDMLRNTRTTKANWLARATFAPHHVNYHLEHHLAMAVPPYKLPKLRKLLKERGVLEGTPEGKSYWEVYRLAGSRVAA